VIPGVIIELGTGCRTPSWVPMTARAAVTGDADTGYAQWWFVGITTAPTKRDTQVGRSGRPGLIGRLPTACLVGNFVTARDESCSLATPTGPCRRRVWQAMLA